MNKDFIEAIEDIEKERGISKEVLLKAVEKALLSAYKKHYGVSENVRVEIDEDTGYIEVLQRKEVVEEVIDDQTEVSLDEARSFDPDYQPGDAIDYGITPDDFGRIAAQNARNVVLQEVRDAERSMVHDEYFDKKTEIISGTIQRVSNETVFVDLGNTEGILSASERVKGERYVVNSRMKFYILDVKDNNKGPQIYLSRSHPGLVKRLFELEVPEIQEGLVIIENLAREAGSRTKLAVSTADESVDPVGACVGTRGIRVQQVVDELFGEKIDIIHWTDNIEENISNSLAPSRVEKVILTSDEEEEEAALAIVPDYQLSLAIGKEGQNVRLAAKLSGWKIDIKSHSQYYEEDSSDAEDAEEVDIDIEADGNLEND